ncbi:conserved hypothetical protein [Brochothrix thermosphacta]|nr:conserved hypothetical protein [Brochothrix thermosphacta]
MACNKRYYLCITQIKTTAPSHHNVIELLFFYVYDIKFVTLSTHDVAL